MNADPGAARAGFVEHCVTDRRRFGLTPGALVERLTIAARHGVGVIQVREGDLPDRELVSLVRRVVEVSRDTKARVIVNDRADVAIAAGARGVHLPAGSVPASRVRAIAPPDFLIGRSVHTIDEADAAIDEGGCDYLLFGTVYSSMGKPAGHPIAGLARLADVCRRSPLPVIAIGGIDRSRVAAVRDAGAAGFAAVGLFMGLTPLPQVV